MRKEVDTAWRIEQTEQRIHNLVQQAKEEQENPGLQDRFVVMIEMEGWNLWDLQHQEEIPERKSA